MPAKLFKMMMQGSSQENTLAHSCLALVIFEKTDLQHDREGFEHEHSPGDHQNQRLVNEYGNNSEHPPNARDPVSPMNT